MPATDAARSNASNAAADREIAGSRVFDAPRELVFAMWSDARHLARWWGPHGFTLTTEKFDFREGGEWRFVMHGPDGRDYKNHIVYREIVRPERIRYSHTSGPQFDATATFVEQGKNKTLVELRSVFATADLRNRVVAEFNAVEGMHQTLARLADELAKDSREPFAISRTFDVPREQMFGLWTDEKHLAKWFGPKGATVVHSKNDLRPGGVYHYGMRLPDGLEIWGRWEYREIVSPERVVLIQSFSDENGAVKPSPFGHDWPREILSTITFEDRGGKTHVTVNWLPLNATDEQWKAFNAERPGMNGGWSGTFERLEKYIATL